MDQALVQDFRRDPSIDHFVAALNDLLCRRGEELLDGKSDPYVECDSLELVVIGLHLEALGAELPPGIEAAIETVEDLHGHACRVLGVCRDY